MVHMNILPETDSKKMSRFEGLWRKVVRPNIENIGFGLEWASHARSGRINTTILHRNSVRIQWSHSQVPKMSFFLKKRSNTQYNGSFFFRNIMKTLRFF